MNTIVVVKNMNCIVDRSLFIFWFYSIKFIKIIIYKFHETVKANGIEIRDTHQRVEMKEDKKEIESVQVLQLENSHKKGQITHFYSNLHSKCI